MSYLNIKQKCWSNPFTLVSTKKEFDILEDRFSSNSSSFATKNQNKQTHQQNKQQIVVPKIQIVNRIAQVKQFAKSNCNYIRIRDQLQLPKLYHYELTEVDHVFVATNQQKYIFKDEKILNQQFFKKIFVWLETKAGKDLKLPKSNQWFIDFLEKEHKDLLTMKKYEQFAQNIYNYWRSRRQQFKFPLFRPLWKPNENKFNYLLPYNARDKKKTTDLRKKNQFSKYNIEVQLKEQLQNAAMIADRIKTRQELKFEQIKIQIVSFHSSCKDGIPQAQIFQFLSMFLQDQLTPQKLLIMSHSNNEKIKQYNKNLQLFKTKKQSAQNPKSQFCSQKALSVDSKQSKIDFLSTMISQASKFGISYENIFKSQDNDILNQKLIDSDLTGSFTMNQEKYQRAQNEKQNIFNFQKIYYEEQDSLIINQRTQQQTQNFSYQQQIDQNLNRSHRTYLQHKREQITKYYFGQDEEIGHNEIIPKFKKFMQINKIIQ